MNVLRNKINDQIDEIASFLGLVSTVDRNEIPLQSFRKVERSLIKGIYIAFSKDHVIYVGQGRVRKRLERLSEKIIGGDFSEKRAKDTDGFEHFRKNHLIDIADCHVIYFETESWAECTAFEGVLIQKLKPLANSETFKDGEKPTEIKNTMIQNVIHLDSNKSTFQSGSLEINGNSYGLPDSLQTFDTKQEYEEIHSTIEQVQSHFDGQMGYIKDIHALIVGGNIEDLSDQMETNFAENSDEVNDFASFVEMISGVATGPFKIATRCWEEIGIAVYYIKSDGDFESVRLDFDDWEETDYFKKIAAELDIDPDSDEFYDEDEDHDEMKSPCEQVCDEIHENHLSHDVTVLAPDWYE